MTSSIESMRREISAEAALAFAKPPSPSQTTKKLQIPETAPKVSKALATEAIKRVEKKSEEEERKELYRKIRGYQKNQILRKYLPEGMEPPKKNDSLEALKNQYGEIESSLKESTKRVMVHQMFDSILQAAEMGAVNFLQMSEKRGLAMQLILHKEEIFEPELEEVIIELEDNWVPSAQTRLAFKLVQCFMAFDNKNLIRKGQDAAPPPASDGPKPPEARVPKAVPKGKN